MVGLPVDEDERREHVARRIRAVQALAGLTSVERMAEITTERGIGLTRLREIYQRRGEIPRAVELREIADACGIPYGIFVLDLDVALDEHATDWHRAIEARLAHIEGSVLGVVVAEPSVEDLTRRTKQALTDPAEDDARATAAAASTRDEEDANPESHRARSAATQRSERSSGA